MKEAGKYWSKCEAQRKKNRKERVSFPLLYVKFTFFINLGEGGGGDRDSLQFSCTVGTGF